MRVLTFRASLTGAASLAVVALGSAQWYYVDIHPSGATSSFAQGTADIDHAVGTADGTPGRAFVYAYPNYTDITPANASVARLYDTNGIFHGGTAVINGISCAGLWNGTATFVNLAPRRSVFSEVFGLYNNRQVGYWQHARSQYPTAAIWSGTAQSVVNLQPQGWNEGSIAYAIFNNTQVGAAATSAYPGAHACRWTNTKNSFVDIHPSSAVGINGSVATDVYGSTAVGIAYFRDPNTFEISGRQAWLWNTTGGTGVSMHPAAYAQSQANSVAPGVAVGRVYDAAGTTRAWLWDLYTNSMLDLHDLLAPGVYDRSFAFGVWTDGIRITVAGGARDVATGQNHAILWEYNPL